MTKHPQKLGYAVLALAVLSIYGGAAIWQFGPQQTFWSSSESCPNGGQYFAQISTSLCGTQYDVCVSFDYNCGNDYHPAQAARVTSAYELELTFLILTGFLELLVAFWLLKRA